MSFYAKIIGFSAEIAVFPWWRWPYSRLAATFASLDEAFLNREIPSM